MPTNIVLLVKKAVKPQKERGAYEKRRRIEFYENQLAKEVPPTLRHSFSFQYFKMIECDEMELNETEDPLSENITFKESVNFLNKKRNKGVQVNIKTSQKNQAVQTNIRRNSV
ncbi:unnamed protein product [Parnassius apollo]|uniref:(apollo) hypothetical protein n=1 Tax=Parnassius apollo TaxID=110799 RepID=A0A8S3XXL3_PARAO|nr:unnamed protein product [Parnassius apollo]